MLWRKLRKIPKNNGVIGHRICLEIRKGARQKWFKFRALWFWRHVHDCIWREQKHVCPAWREIEAAAATSILDTTLSSQVGSIVCCAAVWLRHSRRDTVKWTPRRFVYFFVFGLLFWWGGNFLHFLRAFREKQNHTITEECPDCCLAKHEGNQMSGLGEDTFPKSKSRPPCSWPVNGGACSIAFVSGQFVVDSGCIAATSQRGLAWEGECLQDELQAVPGKGETKPKSSERTFSTKLYRSERTNERSMSQWSYKEWMSDWKGAEDSEYIIL